MSALSDAAQALVDLEDGDGYSWGAFHSALATLDTEVTAASASDLKAASRAVLDVLESPHSSRERTWAFELVRYALAPTTKIQTPNTLCVEKGNFRVRDRERGWEFAVPATNITGVATVLSAKVTAR